MAQRVLIRLGRVNRTVVLLVVAVYVFAALTLPGMIGGTMLLALAAGLAWLLARTWAVHPTRARAARLVVLGALVAVAVIRLTH